MENLSKKKGRPHKIPPRFLDDLRKLYPEYSTARSLNNVFHTISATSALREDEEKYCYLIDRSTGRMRKTILGALGRLEDPDASQRGFTAGRV